MTDIQNLKVSPDQICPTFDCSKLTSFSIQTFGTYLFPSCLLDTFFSVQYILEQHRGVYLVSSLLVGSKRARQPRSLPLLLHLLTHNSTFTIYIVLVKQCIDSM
jgi:hypothetical protein